MNGVSYTRHVQTLRLIVTISDMTSAARSLISCSTSWKGKGVPSTHIQLQKLLYFAHGRFLRAENKPLVSGYFEALGERHPALWRVNLKHPMVTYRPTRRREPDIFNGRGELFREAQQADLETIRELIRKDRFTRNEATERANIEVAECLHNFAVKSRIQARRYHISPFVLTGAAGIKLSYWSPLLLVKDERLHVVFIDPRRENGLTAEGRHFAFSMMHHRARAVYLDLEDAELMICQFPIADDTQRYLKVYTASQLDRPLFSYDELEQRLRETYTIWKVVLAEREADQRRQADRDRGDFNLSA